MNNRNKIQIAILLLFFGAMIMIGTHKDKVKYIVTYDVYYPDYTDYDVHTTVIASDAMEMQYKLLKANKVIMPDSIKINDYVIVK